MSMISIDSEWICGNSIPSESFVCGFCNVRISSAKGFKLFSKQIRGHSRSKTRGGIYICDNCNGPTFISEAGHQYPLPAFGSSVKNVPQNINTLYEEARNGTKAKNYTSSVLLCRKILMHIAVEKGAEPGLPFIGYVNFLEENHYVPPDSRSWVDRIRVRSNEANHEIEIMTQTDAENLITFIEIILRFLYETPSLIR